MNGGQGHVVPALFYDRILRTSGKSGSILRKSMMRQFYGWAGAVVFFIASFLSPQAAQAAQTLQASYLRCEYRIDPAGIDVLRPRLSWTLQSDQRGQKQTAYHVLVATSAGQLANNTGDLWDSGKMPSEETITIEYNGQPLTSGIDCFWKVKVWDKDGTDCGWSTPAQWSMGLLNPSDWQAQWVGFDPVETSQTTPDVVGRASWIWTDANAAQGTQPGSRYFRRSFEVPANWDIKSAVCYVTADDSFTLYVNGEPVKSGTTHTILNQVSLTEALQPGSNVLAVLAANDGSSTNPAGLVVAARIESEGGEVLEIVSDGQWRTSLQAVANWQTAGFDDAAWSNAAVLGTFGMAPWQGTSLVFLPPARYLRQECIIAPKPIKKASLYATALGIYQLYVNGQRVSQDYFSPGWTDYTKRIYYRTYDVTAALQSGSNAIGAVLADGWFAGYVGYAKERNHYGQQLRLLCQVNIEYADGTTQVVASGPAWKASLGPIQQADFLQGESYDARRELPGWNTAGFDDAGWLPAAVGSTEVNPAVQAAVAEPVIAFEEVTPVSVSEPTAGHYVFDMGQNFAGVVRLKVQGQAGQTIQLRHAERLNPDGTLYTANLRSAASIDTYTCKGGGVEIWQPYFTFHGFQYVEVTGVDSTPGLDMVVGLALSSDTPTIGTFECSDAVVNKVQANSVWTQRANFIDIPTDCPQRDERLGWTGDAQVYVNTAAYHNDVQAFFTKWLVDLADGQRADGQFPTVAPLKVSHGDGGPAWADAGVICPWTIYKMYGDKQLLETHYEGMKRFTAFTKNRCTSELLPPASFHCFGDWLNINDNTPHDVIFMAYFGHSTNLTAQTAEVLGKTAEAAAYRQLFEQIKTSFNNAYVAADGKIKGDTQTAYVMAIAYDLLDASKQQLAAGHLVRRIKECNWHLATGFVGTKDLMLALAKIGRNDIAYRLLHNNTFPSWGFSIKHGATSIWERWNGWTPESGFADPGMNSFAHYSFGAVCQWIFENIGGIQTDGPAFKQIVLKPQPGGKLTWAKTDYRSIRGLIRTDWKTEGSVFDCKVTIPPNTTATLYIPAASAQVVTESGQPAGQAEGVAFVKFENGYAVYTIQSGSYAFKSRSNWSRFAWTGDADSQISAGKVYTHKVNLHRNESQGTAINGVLFENDDNRSGPNWSLIGAPLQHSSTGYQVTGDSAQLISDFFYFEPARLELAGLTPANDYVLTCYTRGFGGIGERLVNLTTSADGITTTLDQNGYGNGEGCLFRYAYTAPASGQLAVTFEALNSDDTWHHYAFSNEAYAPVYLDPLPLPDAEVSAYDALSWTVHGAVAEPSYHVVIATNPNMTDPAVDQSGLFDSAFNPPLSHETDYYWQVEVLEGASAVYTSPVWHFRTLPAPPEPVKLLEWRFDETQGTVAEQTVSGAGGNGILHGFNDPDLPQVRVSGLVGNALCLNGVDEYVDVSGARDVMPVSDGEDFSISGYIRTFGNYGPLFSMRNSTNETPIIDISLGADGIQNQPGKVCVLVRDNAGSMSNMNSGITVNDGRWHHFIVTRYHDDWMLYIDGTLRADMTNVATGSLTLDMMGIGASLKWLADDWQPQNSHYRYFTGAVDEYTVWQGTLQPHHIRQLSAIVPAAGDLNADGKMDLQDFADLAADWFVSSITPVQAPAIVEDMESYTSDPSSYQDYWVYTPEAGFGTVSLSMEPDTDGLYGQIMRMDYDFNGRTHAHVPLRLLDRRINASLYDQLTIRFKKLTGCDVTKIILDFYDGRYNIDPIAEGLHSKGRLTFDISSVSEQQWHTLPVTMPDDITFTSCTDLYQIMLSIEDGGQDSGTLLIDGMMLSDETLDCIPRIGEMTADVNADCLVDVQDLRVILENWLNPF
jgi:alpha-L-rhamnosidase